MTCREAEEQLSRYTFGELDSSERELFEQHLASCGDCRRVAADMATAAELLGEGLLVEPAPVLSSARRAALLTAAGSASLPPPAAAPPVRRFPWRPNSRALGLAAAATLFIAGLAGLLVRQLRDGGAMARQESAPAATAAPDKEADLAATADRPALRTPEAAADLAETAFGDRAVHQVVLDESMSVAAADPFLGAEETADSLAADDIGSVIPSGTAAALVEAVVLPPRDVDEEVDLAADDIGSVIPSGTAAALVEAAVLPPRDVDEEVDIQPAPAATAVAAAPSVLSLEQPRTLAHERLREPAPAPPVVLEKKTATVEDAPAAEGLQDRGGEPRPTNALVQAPAKPRAKRRAPSAPARTTAVDEVAAATADALPVEPGLHVGPLSGRGTGATRETRVPTELPGGARADDADTWERRHHGRIPKLVLKTDGAKERARHEEHVAEAEPFAAQAERSRSAEKVDDAMESVHGAGAAAPPRWEESAGHMKQLGDSKRTSERRTPGFGVAPARAAAPLAMAPAARSRVVSKDVVASSFSQARSYILNRHEMPPSHSVHVEEFINAFAYSYPRTGTSPVSIHVQAGPSPSGRDVTLLSVGLLAQGPESARRTGVRDVQIHAAFNPARVRRCRVFGHGDRGLTKPGELGTSVVVGEMRNGQSLTVVYELELSPAANPTERRNLGTVTVRYRAPGSKPMAEQSVPLRSDVLAARTPARSPGFFLAAAAAEFAAVLRGDIPAARAQLEGVRGVVAQVANALPGDPQVRTLAAMVEAAEALTAER